MHPGSNALHRTVTAVAAVLSICMSRSGLQAQTPEQRRALDAFRDSLYAVTDSTVLQREESRLMAEARRARNDAYLHLRLGQLALRQADLGGPSHYDDAASEFKWGSELAPLWPYAWFGLGLAEYALGSRDGNRGDSRSPLGRDAWVRASEAFARAAVLEPGLAPRLEELARQALRGRAPDRATVIRDALRRATREAHSPHEGRLFLALGRVERELGDSAARGAFESYLAVEDVPGIALLELGRTRLLAGELAGAADYYEGIASDDPGAVAEARSDLAPIAGDDEMADFDFRRGPARAEMVRRFWTVRDRIDLRPEGARLAEHLRRLAVARKEFLFNGPDGVERLDDRGRVFVRHGEPDDRASFKIPGVEPNESWRYRRGGTDMVLHFAARLGPGDFRLIESVLDVSDVRSSIGFGTPPGASAASASGAQLLRSRSALSALYRELPSRRSDQAADFLVRERALGRRGIQLGTRTDSYTLRFPVELDAWGAFVVVGGSGSEPAVQVLFAIPGYAVEPATGTAGIVYPVRVRFVALDSVGNVVATVDTVTRLEPGDRIAANRSLLGRLAVPVRPGRLTVQAAIQYGENAGTAFGVDSVMVPSPGSGRLALGDVLVGTPRGRLMLPLGDGRQIALTPGGVVHRSDGLDLAVEIFGLAPGQSTQLRVMVAPRTASADTPGEALAWRPYPDGRAESRVARSASGSPITTWRTSLGLKKLKPGSWLLAVIATDSSGHESRREAALEVQLP